MVVLVSNDLAHDQRVAKTCQTLEKDGWEVFLIGRLLSDSQPMKTARLHHRIALPFQKGVWFYASLQIALFWKLLWLPYDAIWANDLDTLLPASLMKFIRSKPVIYDSHEFFTEAAGLTGRGFQRSVWLALEAWLLPRTKAVITVNDSIADAYRERYPKSLCGRPIVVRNMPVLQPRQERDDRVWEEFNIPCQRPIFILQGAFLDQDRGVREAVQALRTIQQGTLVVVGAGSEFDWAQEQVASLRGRLHCLPKLPFESLRKLTASADIGLSLDRGVHGNYWMSLPNKLFDYIHAGIPVVASPMPEVERVVTEWNVGAIIEDHEPESIAQAIHQVLQLHHSEWGERCDSASRHLNWEAEEPKIFRALEMAGLRIRRQPASLIS
tara:strand:- start:1540 stop:2685 length:1146 start_codon:yes stop_codon:yes gene_type:complete